MQTRNLKTSNRSIGANVAAGGCRVNKRGRNVGQRTCTKNDWFSATLRHFLLADGKADNRKK
jgi:hypothetical protein